MHRCFLIPEIVSLIIDTGPPGSPQDTSSLARLARTSRVFHNVSLDVLWYGQFGLANLIKCMPADLWTEDDGKLSFTRPLLASDLERFDYYAHRIRALTLSRYEKIPSPWISPNVTVGSNVFKALSLFRLSTPPLPNITQLGWSGGSAFTYCIMFLGPKLNLLQVTSTRPITAPALASVLSHLRYLAAPLQSIYLNFQDWSNDYSKPLEQIADFPDLRTFSYTSGEPLSVEIFAILGQMPHLENLELCLKTIPQPLYPLPGPGSPHYFPFTALKEFSLSTSSITVCVTVVSALSLRNIRSVSFDVLHAASVGQLLEVVHDHCSWESLESILIHTSFNARKGHPSDEVVAQASLRSLYDFHKMKNLTIMTDSPLEMDNSDLQDMASSWPHLEELCLIYNPLVTSWEQHSAITLQGLVPLVKQCPTLSVLSLPIAFTVGDGYTRLRPGGGHSNDRVTQLHCGGRCTAGPAQIASFLSDLFPNLQEIAGYYPGELNDPKNPWREIEEYLPGFAAIRKQERISLEAQGKVEDVV
ncbi:hypothetical protein SCP_0506020 [Sparassis crispa]|uniref:F-box domain-containing protein n=1 Tax=Sparassis crispa TaxID=139825 RepID=A0A401GMT9_9APHY|nr:hypothetical protein SCP_0506020 [Sparassis crispa]GBE83547.1 hypothetical protein SCP_0506020 [Sparassis crispa]